MAEPTDEIQEILQLPAAVAERMLNEHGEFYPYAAALGSDGELNAVATDVDDDSPDVAEALLALHVGPARAGGRGCDPRVRHCRGRDAHGPGQRRDRPMPSRSSSTTRTPTRVDIFVPYETEGEGIKFGELVAAEGREPVFAHAAS